MAPIRSSSPKRGTPAELAEHFRAEQQRLKQDAADRRAAAEERRTASGERGTRRGRRA